MKNKKRLCDNCPECNPTLKKECFWKIEKSVPLHFKPSIIKACVSVESTSGIVYLKAVELDGVMFDSEFLSWLLSFCVANKINVFWQTKNIPFFLGNPDFLRVTETIKKQESL
jgi:hypothetical protein